MARRSSVEEVMFRNVWNRVLIKEEMVPRGIAFSFDGFEKKVNVLRHCSTFYSQCNDKTTRTTSHQMLSSVWTSRFSRDSSDHLRSSCSSSSSAMPLSGEHVMAARTWCHTVTVYCHWCDSRGALPQPRRKLSLPSKPLSTDLRNSTISFTLQISVNSFMKA